MYKFALLVLVCIPALTLADFHECKHGNYPKEIHMSHCGLHDDRCSIKIGTKLEFEMEFVAKSAARTVTPHVEASWSIFPWLTVDLDDEDQIGCNSIVTLDEQPGCPLVAGQRYKYRVNVDIKRLKWIGYNVEVQIYLQGDDVRQTCFAFDAST